MTLAITAKEEAARMRRVHREFPEAQISCAGVAELYDMIATLAERLEKVEMRVASVCPTIEPD